LHELGGSSLAKAFLLFSLSSFSLLLETGKQKGAFGFALGHRYENINIAQRACLFSRRRGRNSFHCCCPGKGNGMDARQGVDLIFSYLPTYVRAREYDIAALLTRIFPDLTRHLDDKSAFLNSDRFRMWPQYYIDFADRLDPRLVTGCDVVVVEMSLQVGK
jgi:hypothetical protein